jgi:hypothetical protein
LRKGVRVDNQGHILAVEVAVSLEVGEMRSLVAEEASFLIV